MHFYLYICHAARYYESNHFLQEHRFIYLQNAAQSAETYIQAVRQKGQESQDVTLGFVAINVAALCISFFMSNLPMIILSGANVIRFSYCWLMGNIADEIAIQRKLLEIENNEYRENNAKHHDLNDQQEQITQNLANLTHQLKDALQALPTAKQLSNRSLTDKAVSPLQITVK